MSLLDSLVLALAQLGAFQLGCAFVAAMAYPVVLDATLAARARCTCAAIALLAAGAFAAALAGDWPSGVALMLLGVGAFAVFAGVAWATSLVLGLDGRGQAAPAPLPRPDEAPGRRAPTPPVPQAAGLH